MNRTHSGPVRAARVRLTALFRSPEEVVGVAVLLFAAAILAQSALAVDDARGACANAGPLLPSAAAAFFQLDPG